MTRKRPTPEQFEFAVMWLQSYEPDKDEINVCAVVAEWIETEEYEHMLRHEARKAGVTVARLRRHLTLREQESKP